MQCLYNSPVRLGVFLSSALFKCSHGGNERLFLPLITSQAGFYFTPVTINVEKGLQIQSKYRLPETVKSDAVGLVYVL